MAHSNSPLKKVPRRNHYIPGFKTRISSLKIALKAEMSFEAGAAILAWRGRQITLCGANQRSKKMNPEIETTVEKKSLHQSQESMHEVMKNISNGGEVSRA
jgi:hypothetical protein